MNPLISVIVPCYNQAQYLDECLQSVLNQTYQNWECIIVNDGSPDNTEEIAKKWLEKDPRFKYMHKENGGLSSARNAGIREAKGEWIQFLDCDDILEKNKLCLQSNYFEKQIDILVSGYRYFENNEGVSKKRIFGRNYFLPEVAILQGDNIDVKQLFKIKNPFVISAPLYSKKIFLKIGLFNEKLKSLEDWEFNLRCALNNYTFHHVGYADDSKVLIRLHEESMMRNQELMIANQLLFNEICNKNRLYVECFGKIESEKNSSFKDYLNLFIPPVFFIIKNKIFNAFKNKISCILSSTISPNSRKR